MLDCRLRAYTTWPGETTRDRRSGQFRVGYSQLLEEISDELERLLAKDVVLQLGLPEAKIRAGRRSYDGWPKADVKPVLPGVILSFETLRKPLEFQCDTYLDWTDNLRAISLTLTALRAVERYGATRKRQQYRGYEALPPPPAEQPAAPIGPTAAAMTLVMAAGEGVKDQVLESAEEFKRIYRLAALRCHPDREGTEAQMTAVNQAADVLKKRHGL